MSQWIRDNEFVSINRFYFNSNKGKYPSFCHKTAEMGVMIFFQAERPKASKCHNPEDPVCGLSTFVGDSLCHKTVG